MAPAASCHARPFCYLPPCTQCTLPLHKSGTCACTQCGLCTSNPLKSPVPITALAVVLMMVSGRFGWLSPRRSSKPASGPPHIVLPADLSYEGDAAVQFADGDAACKRCVGQAAWPAEVVCAGSLAGMVMCRCAGHVARTGTAATSRVGHAAWSAGVVGAGHTGGHGQWCVLLLVRRLHHEKCNHP